MAPRLVELHRVLKPTRLYLRPEETRTFPVWYTTETRWASESAFSSTNDCSNHVSLTSISEPAPFPEPGIVLDLRVMGEGFQMNLWDEEEEEEG